ncbi:hypothetical protein FAZ19_09900 [Sphingobacterium alkalisoli]|uniref:Outer membrane protein beta-barrel domain-containing protein n=1 Tax=Sphingobacterium alkalisoli TaxID=1874115 RepID=A0A4V5LYM7_9SPHI|nr:hypothetical protein [Sphingobacterium alkalisoli]TJY65449.1 hypothetical protein FAZ19_09900 [Sphingobacterium alkalisoli]GGH20396.1 hypothetical protein GCM10011418_25560 [Sphingobacterium alkalisoli]
MRILLLIICSLLISTFLSAQTSPSSHDRIIRQAADHVGTGQYEAALSALAQLEGQKRQAVIDERFYYFSIKARYQVLIGYENQGYDNIQAIRTLSKQYLEKFKTGKRAEITDISDNLDLHYPKTRSDYDDWLTEQHRLAFQRRQADALATLERSYHTHEYEAVLKRVADARQDGIGSHQFDYYEILAKNELFKLTNRKDFRAIEELHLLSETYLNENTLDDEARRTVEEIVQKYPKTLEDFQTMLESERLAAIERSRGEKLGKLQSDYYRGHYTIVMQATDTFEPKSEMAASFAFFQAMSAYKQLLDQKDTYYSKIAAPDVSKVRTDLVAYQEFYGVTQPENRRHIDMALADLNRNFGANDQQFNRLKKSSLAQREKAIRRAKRRMFFSVGYEYGEIAPYGLRFEVGGRAIGLFTTVRTSLVNSQDVQTTYGAVPNKNEVIAGPNVKLASWLFWNIGAGYGYFFHNYRDDYRDLSGVKKSSYISGYTGVTLRTGSVFNFIGGASFMDINKKYTDQFTKPEYTIGITFNLK